MGQVIAGRFELVEHIASGASGSIWHAHDLKRNAPCAAKVLRQKDSGELLRFVREQGVRLHHPHLASPYGWAAEDDDVAIAMPLVRGGTLEGALGDHGALGPELTATLLLQLLEATRHVHAAGWIHRDIKPANILLEPTGTNRPHLRLGDFGTALRMDEPRLTQLGHVHGTPGYLPPEALHGAAPSPAADLYATGIVGLRMLYPEATTPTEISAARKQLVQSTIPAPLRTTVLDLTDDDVERRKAAAHEAVTTLEALTQATGWTSAHGEPFEVFDHVAMAEQSAPTQLLTPRQEETHAPVTDHRSLPLGPLILISAGLILVVIAALMLL